MTDPRATDPVYDVVAAFAAGLAEHGVTDVVISPGSRSTPLAVTLHAQPALRSWIQIDERSAGFFALGQARRTGRPSVLVCTSGTAAANYLPAVVEAHHAGVPMIVCTADRPPELRGWGAGQTIDQVGLYGATTRWAADLPVAGEWTPGQARIAAHRAVEAAGGADAGPVHLNWPLREPLEPAGEVPVVPVGAVVAVEPGADPGPRPSDTTGLALADLAGETRGVVIVGPDTGRGLDAQQAVAEAVLGFCARRDWPVIGEPVSGVRRAAGPADALRIANADHLLKDEAVAAELAPEVVIRVGNSPTTKPVRLWLQRHRPATVVLVDPAERWHDPSFTVTHHLTHDPVDVLRRLSDLVAPPPDRRWRDRWAELDLAAAGAVGEELANAALMGPLIARVVADALPDGSLVMTSNSLPVRDLDAYVSTDGPLISFVGNRGASGIDGITSTALGLASRHEHPVVLITGDLALLHDLGALFGAARAGLHVVAVCVDNGGGGIFSMLPIAARGEAVGFDTLFRTPHRVDLAGFDGVGGVRVQRVETAVGLRTALSEATATREPGVDLLVVPVDDAAELAQREAIAAAVGAALR